MRPGTCGIHPCARRFLSIVMIFERICLGAAINYTGDPMSHSGMVSTLHWSTRFCNKYAQNRPQRRFMNELNGSNEMYKTHNNEKLRRQIRLRECRPTRPHETRRTLRCTRALTYAVHRFEHVFGTHQPTKIRRICIMIEISRCDRNHCLWARARETLASRRWPHQLALHRIAITHAHTHNNLTTNPQPHSPSS